MCGIDLATFNQKVSSIPREYYNSSYDRDPLNEVLLSLSTWYDRK
jgi:hypothetical protein